MTVTTDRDALEEAVSQLTFQANAYEAYMYNKCGDIEEMLAMSTLVASLKATVKTLTESL